MTETYEYQGVFLPVWQFADQDELNEWMDGLGQLDSSVMRGGTVLPGVDGILFTPPATPVAAFRLGSGWPVVVDDEDEDV
jgi:hypothetical protein